MLSFKAPLKDLKFQFHDLFNLTDHVSGLAGFEETTKDDIDMVLEEAAKFAEKEVAPLMRVGDEEGVTFKDGKVTLPKGWAASYRLFNENGWPLLEAPKEWGGSQSSAAMGAALSEMLASANPCWGMLSGLTVAANKVIDTFAEQKIKDKFLPRLTEGSFNGTMCLTEPHCGTDLGLVQTKAEESDGLYLVSGSKMFITAGDHDAADNIIHLVLARLPDAPKGTKGISLFLVPKIWVEDDGRLSDLNGVTCGSIEHKMGIKASPTCVMNFDKAKGYLVGKPNEGLQAMFVMMNIARVGTGIQGYAAGSRSFQVALDYAKDRLQMRSLTGKKNKEGPADPIIVHPDVRRMLLTQKALTEGCRSLTTYCSLLMDKEYHAKDEQERQDAKDILGLMTPILKGFATEAGIEVTNHGIQILGGHGYINEHGQEQLARDCRISSIYEGTTQIQALDLLGRKILMNEGRNLRKFTKQVHLFCEAHKEDENLKGLISSLAKRNKQLGDLTMKIGMAGMANPDEVGAASVDYLMYAGYVVLGYFWAKSAKVSYEKKDAVKGEDAAFYTSKIKTAEFYFERILPRCETLSVTMVSGAKNLMSLDAEHFFG